MASIFDFERTEEAVRTSFTPLTIVEGRTGAAVSLMTS